MTIEAALTTGQIAVARSGLVDYENALKIQRIFHAEIVADERPNTLILLEHPSVYTAGRRTAISDRPTDSTPVIDVDRGGKITWHGPGQLVGYPIVKLANRLDVVGFVRQLETALINTCEQFGLVALRYPERSGVWLRDEKGDRIATATHRGRRIHFKNPTREAHENQPCRTRPHFGRIDSLTDHRHSGESRRRTWAESAF